MEIFPEWLSRTIFGVFSDAIYKRIGNKYLKIAIYAIVFILSILIAFGMAITVMLSIAWVLLKLSII
jgi:hypothetical protein